jgi:hypothetical protein
VNLRVDNIQSINWRKDLFKALVLPPTTKDVVDTLVVAHRGAHGTQQLVGMTGSPGGAVSSYGNGLVILLHGGSGAGKTLTARK